MRKYFALLIVLVFTLSLLTSCELFVPGPSERLTGSLPSLPAGTKDPAPTQTADPTADEYGFTIFPEGNYLADPKFDTDEFLPDYDADPSFIQILSTSSAALCSTEDTIYTCVEDASGAYIMYTDKTTGITLPLCGKPECLHNGNTCNAYVANNADGLSVYGGMLYWLEGRSRIMRMNLDGTDRQIVVSSAGGAYGSSTINPTFVFHRGYAYFARVQNIVKDGKAINAAVVNAQPIDGGEYFTILDRPVYSLGLECLIKPVGNDLYIMLYSFDYEDEENLDGVFDHIELYRWDSMTRQAEFITSITTSPDGLRVYNRSFHPVPEDGIYLQGRYWIKTEDGISEKNGVVKYCFSSGGLEEVLWPVGEWNRSFSYPYYVKDYIIVMSAVEVSPGNYERTPYMYDYDGNLVFSKFIGEHGFSVFMGADDTFTYSYCIHSIAEPGHYIAIPLDGGEIIVIK